jgi:hypothetical protein
VNFSERGNNSGVAMGFDFSGCPNVWPIKSNYLGAGIAAAANTSVFIDLDGRRFDLLSLNGTVHLRVLSSNGGFFEFFVQPAPYDNFAFHPQSFSGPEWTGLSWIAFQGGFGGAPTTPVDNILFNVNAVNEPATLALIGASLSALALACRRTRRSLVA